MDQFELLRLSLRLQKLLLQRNVIQPQFHEKIHSAVFFNVLGPSFVYQWLPHSCLLSLCTLYNYRSGRIKLRYSVRSLDSNPYLHFYDNFVCNVELVWHRVDKKCSFHILHLFFLYHTSAWACHLQRYTRLSANK